MVLLRLNLKEKIKYNRPFNKNDNCSSFYVTSKVKMDVGIYLYSYIYEYKHVYIYYLTCKYYTITGPSHKQTFRPWAALGYSWHVKRTGAYTYVVTYKNNYYESNLTVGNTFENGLDIPVKM